MYQKRKRYNTAVDRFSDFKLGTGVVIKAEKDWRGVGRPQVAMHSQLPRFLVATFSSILYFDGRQIVLVRTDIKHWLHQNEQELSCC